MPTARKLAETGAVMLAFLIRLELFADRVVDAAKIAGAEKAAGLRGAACCRQAPPALQVSATFAPECVAERDVRMTADARR
jgi:hypothetical protein